VSSVSKEKEDLFVAMPVAYSKKAMD